MKTIPAETSLPVTRRFPTRSPLWRRGAAIALIALTSTNAVEASELQPTEAARYVYAEVVQADPIIEVVRDPFIREVCRDVHQSEERQSVTPHILGGIIGGVVGNQIGSGSGRTAATIAGAALGASLGADHARKRRDSHAERCELTEDYHERERVVGYRVTYRYDGEIRTAETQERPGKYLKLELRVASAVTTE
ncbi:MAG: glycine zipper 2TM domain-containing protein [Proteobacteria bacterium]|nr:glycine zipper 2TM domain-containing protein [Pseudomonadota bacterium]